MCTRARASCVATILLAWAQTARAAADDNDVRQILFEPLVAAHIVRPVSGSVSHFEQTAGCDCSAAVPLRSNRTMVT